VSLPDETPTNSTEEIKPQTRMSRRHVVEWIAVLLVAVVASFVIRVYVVQTFEVPSGSMLPTLQVGDRLIVDKIPGLAHRIHRGDIIVFHRAPGDTDPQYPILVKRVIVCQVKRSRRRATPFTSTGGRLPNRGWRP